MAFPAHDELEELARSGVKFVAKARRAGLGKVSFLFLGEQGVFCEIYLGI